MALIKKTVFNLTPVKDTLLSEVIESCEQHFGKLLASVEKEVSEMKEGVPFKLGPNLIMDSKGRHMNINTSNIVWEEDRYPEDEEYNLSIILNYLCDMGISPDTVSKEDVKKANERMVDLLWHDIVLAIKIMKLGDIEYYFYSVEQVQQGKHGKKEGCSFR